MITAMSTPWTTTGADYATMATGLSALTAAAVWIRRQWRERQERRAQTKNRNWSAYIEPNGISDWFVRVAEDAPVQDAQVVLQIVTADGRPGDQMAGGLRRVVERDGRLAAAPTEAQMAFLIAMRKERFGEGYPVR
jgi:hypothetical protein